MNILSTAILSQEALMIIAGIAGLLSLLLTGYAGAVIFNIGTVKFRKTATNNEQARGN